MKNKNHGRRFTSTLIGLLAICDLTAQTQTVQEWYLKSRDSLDLYVREVGRGKDTVIVLHGGFGANHDYMLDIANGLDDTFHFIFYDQRGSALSPAPGKKLTFPNNVDDLYQLVNELKIKEAKIICHSMGSLVGMEFLKLYPERVSNLLLVGSLPTISDTIGGSSIFSRRYEQQVDFLMNRKEVTDIARPYRERNGDESTQVGYYNYKSSLTDKEQTELWRIEFASVNIYQIEKWRMMKGGRAYYKGAAAVMTDSVDWLYDYRNILNAHGKVTIMMGDYDFLDFNSENHKSHLANYPFVKLITVKNSGHNIWIDEPEVFKMELIKSLRN